MSLTPGAADVLPPLAARYFDGQRSRAHQVILEVRDGVAYISGDAERTCALAQLRVSERTVHALRKVTFPDGAYLEIADHQAFNALLARTGQRDSLVVRLQQSWRATLWSLGGIAAALVLGYLFVLPKAASWIASALPVSVERKLGSGVLEAIDKSGMLAPSALPRVRQDAIRAAFARLAPPRAGAPSYNLVFRKSKMGPNAFALPSGDIILTDEMVTMLNDEQGVMGVLAHELGHLHEHHMTSRIVQSSAVAGVTALLFGDVSSVVAAVPTFLLDMAYSRDAEREADRYAIAMLKQNGIALEHLAQVFVKMASTHEKLAPPPYLSSHPASAERIARIRQGQE